MNRFLLLILLSSWSTVVPLPVSRCGPRVTHPGETLDVPHSLVSNADVAILKAYRADDANACSTDCCTQKFGSCTIATFTRTSRHGNNCRHFNCRPLAKCIFSSSNTIDSVSYFSSPLSSSVPSRSAFLSSSLLNISAPDSNVTHDQHASDKSDPPTKKDSLQQISTTSDQPVRSKLGYQTMDDLQQSVTTVSDQQMRTDLHQIFSTESSAQARNDSHQVSSFSDQNVSQEANGQVKNNSHQQVSTESVYQNRNKSEQLSAHDLNLDNGTTEATGVTDFEVRYPAKKVGSKPRKGVDQTDDFSEDIKRKGVKPRKGVSLDQVVVDNNLSNIKPRKGVGAIEPSPSTVADELLIQSSSVGPFIAPSILNVPYDGIANDLTSALEKVFEDDPVDGSISATTTTMDNKSAAVFTTSISPAHHLTMVTSQIVSSSRSGHSSVALQSSYSTSSVVGSSAFTPDLQPETTAPSFATRLMVEPSKIPSIYEHSVLLFHDASVEDRPEQHVDGVGETEKERKYQTSMHLVLSLVFGLLVLCVVLGVVAKRLYDGWLRRHYRRMDFLIDGMYNGY